MPLGEGTGSSHAPSPYFGAGVIVAGLVVLVVGVVYMNRSDDPPRLVVPTAEGVTPPTDSDGRTVEIPPSQPAGVVTFGADGSVLRPDPVRARVIDRQTGIEILITLPPNTAVDAVTGAIIPRPPGSSGPTTVTTGRSTTTSSRPGTTAGPTTTLGTTTTTLDTTTTEDTTTTTVEETTTTTVEETTTTETVPPDTTDSTGP